MHRTAGPERPLPRRRPAALPRALALAALLLPAALQAQQPLPGGAPPEPGARVRVVSVGPPAIRLAGRLQRVHEDGLEVLTPTGSRYVPAALLDTLQVSRGSDFGRGAFHGAGIGALAGGAALGVLTLATARHPNDDAQGPGEDFLLGVFMGAPFGAVLGGLFGAVTRPERWETVSPRLAAGRAGSGGGVALGVRLALP